MAENSKLVEAIKHEMGWRYLDSLDTVRFSQNYFPKTEEIIPLRLIPARFDFMKSILWGTGITVPNNQLIDSVGFLDIFSEMVEAANRAEKKGKVVYIPVRFALFDYGRKKQIWDSYSLSARLFENTNFYLSAWPNLDNETRGKWAYHLRNYEPIPEELTKGFDEQLGKLYKVLYFFSSRRIGHQVPANKTQGIREGLLTGISEISEETITSDLLLSAITDEKQARVMDIVKVIRNLVEAKNSPRALQIDNRSVIRKELEENPDSVFQGIDGDVEYFKAGVLRTIDGIYNVAGSIGSAADQDSHSRETSPFVFRSFQGTIQEEKRHWGYEEAGYALETWVRTYAKSKYPEYDHGYLRSLETTTLDTEMPIEKFALSTTDQAWDNFFEYQQSFDWLISLREYRRQVNILEDFKKKIQNKSSLSKEEKSEFLSNCDAYLEKKTSHEEKIEKILEGAYKLEDGYLNANSRSGGILGKAELEDYCGDKEVEDYVLSSLSRDAIKGTVSV